MKFYFAGSCLIQGLYDQLTQMNPIPAPLYTYWDSSGEFHKNKAYRYGWETMRRVGKVFVDSGAYSAFTHNSHIDIDKYISYLEQLKGGIACASVLDVIGDHATTQKNYQQMTDHSYDFPILNAVHYGATAQQIRDALDATESGYIAVGGLVTHSKNKPNLMRFLDRFWSVAKDYSPIRAHAFGITAPQILTRYPFYSCDSTSAIVGGGLGRVMTYDKGNVTSYKYKQQDKITHKTFGLVDNGQTEHIKRRLNNIVEMQKLEQYITDLWTKRGIIWD